MKVTGGTASKGIDDQGPVIVDIEMAQSYRHSLGSSSPFFHGLAGGTIRATACGSCGATFLPPRDHCPDDQTPTTWYDLPGTGTVVSATRVHTPPPFGGIEAPYLLAVIRLDGVDGSLTHRVIGDDIPAAGTPVRAVFDGSPALSTDAGQQASIHPLLQLAFECVEEAP